jgi:hypothetical protein
VLDNPEVTMPQARLPEEFSSQPELESTSRRRSAENPLYDLIMIYDDEESS